jgi:hypothetical protein
VIDDILDDVVRAYPDVAAIGLGATTMVVVVHAAVTRARGRAQDATPRVGPVGRFAWLATLAGVLVLGGTALISVWLDGGMHGWALLAHAAIGGALTAVLAVFALTWARPNRRRTRPRFGALTRVSFWLLLLFGVTTAGSMLASTYPLFGTVGLERLLDVHRFAGLGLVVATALHGYLVFSTRP